MNAEGKLESALQKKGSEYRYLQMKLNYLCNKEKKYRNRREDTHAIRYDELHGRQHTDNGIVNWISKCERIEGEIEDCRMEMRKLAECIERNVPAQYLPIVWMAYFEGRSVQEIAGTLQMKPRMVKRILELSQTITA